jgi:hypothetical protein
MRPNEKEINHGRVLWQTRLKTLRNGAVGFIGWLDGLSLAIETREKEANGKQRAEVALNEVTSLELFENGWANESVVNL